MGDHVMQVCMSSQVWRAMSEQKRSLRIMTAFDFDITRAVVDEDTDTLTVWCGCYDPSGDEVQLEMSGQFNVRAPDEWSELPYWQSKRWRIEDVRGLSPEEVAKYLRDNGMRPRYKGAAPEALGMVIADQEYSDFAVLGRVCLDACCQNTELATGARGKDVVWDWDLTFTSPLTAALLRQRSTLGRIARYCSDGSNQQTLNFATIFAWLKDLADIAHAMETP